MAEVHEVVQGDGYALANIDALGEGPGFRKIRAELGVRAFGINAIVMPPGQTSRRHYHETQEETYFVHQGTIEFTFGAEDPRVLGPGGVARVDAGTPRRMRNLGQGEAIFVCAGGKDGYVGRDGVLADEDPGASR
jgi:mannose-6-phosphate isomerase-like protein (cupin superfamily)